MPTYRVAFDGKWQESFDDLGDAAGWAAQVAETGRLVFLVRGRIREKLIGVYRSD